MGLSLNDLTHLRQIQKFFSKYLEAISVNSFGIMVLMHQQGCKSSTLQLFS